MLKKFCVFFAFLSVLLLSTPTQAGVSGFLTDEQMIGINCSYPGNICMGGLTIQNDIYQIDYGVCNHLIPGQNCQDITDYVAYSSDQGALLSAYLAAFQTFNDPSTGRYLTGYGNCFPNGGTSCYAIYNVLRADPNTGVQSWVSEQGGTFGTSLLRAATPTCPNGGNYISGSGCTIPSATGSTPATQRTSTALNNNCAICNLISSLSHPQAGDPISIVDGAKVAFRQDLDSPLPFARNYTSSRTASHALGNGWRYTFDKRLSLTSATASTGSYVSTLDFNEENEEDIIFTRTNPTSSFAPAFVNQNGYQVSVQGSGYMLTTPSGNTETYDSNGNLIAWHAGSGYGYTFTYSNGAVTSITDSYNHTLNITYSNGLMSHIVSDNTDYIDYTYDTNRNLIQAQYNGSETIQYGYTNNLLTSVTDENGNLYDVTSYDTQSRAIETKNVLNSTTFVHDYTVNYSDSNNTVISQVNINGLSFTYPVNMVNNQIISTGESTQGTGLLPQYSVTYDSNGNINSYRDGNGNRTQMTYSATNLIQTLIKADNTQTTFTWDSTKNLLLSLTEPSATGSRTVNNTYDTNRNLIQKQIVTTAETRNWAFYYQSNGRIISQTAPNGAGLTYTYYSDTDANSYERGLLKTITNSLGQTTTVNSYDLHGNPTSVTNANHVTKLMSYDSRSRLTSETVGSATNHYVYDNAGNMTQANFSNGYSLTMTYDQAHRLTTISDNLNNSTAVNLDDNDQPILEQTSQGSSLITVKNKVFDQVGRMTKAWHSNTSEYANATYDRASNITNYTDENQSNTHSYGYDSLNRLNSETAYNVTQSLTFDNANNVVKNVINNTTTQYGYDDFNELTQLVSPDSGTDNLVYSMKNNTVQDTDNKGTVHTTTFDLANRPVTITHINGSTSQNETFHYDTATNGLGLLASLNDTTGSTSYSYDSLENITSKTENIGSMTKTVGYGYDISNQMTSITYPSGLVVNYTYTKGQISGIDLSGTLTANVLHQITYRPFSQVMTVGVWGNAQTFSNSYDQNEKLTALQDSGKINLTFTMDGVDNITQAVDNLDSTKTFNAGYNYDYGLTSFVQNGSGTNYSGTPSGNYNRNSMSSNGNSTSYNYVSNSNILSSYSINSGAGITVTTDANGNITADGTSASYSYDLKNNLTGFNGTASYGLNALNQRVSKTVNGVTTYFVYDENSNLLGEYDSSGNPIIEHIYMNGMPVATVKAGVLYYVHTDQLGTPRVITDTSNDTVWHWDNTDAFGGNLPTENGLSGYNLRFSGQYFDNESNLSYNNNRTYNPKLGRYMQVDPIGLAGGNNTFNYAGNNPLIYSDKKGLFIQLAEIVVPPLVGGAIGGIVGALAGGTQWNGGFNIRWNNDRAFAGAKRGAIEGALAGAAITGTGKIIGMLIGENITTQVIANVGGQASANIAAQLLDSSCKEVDYNEVAFAGLFGLFTAPAFKPYTLLKQPITSWADRGIIPDFNSGRWVMTGSATRLNFLFTGLRSSTADSTNYLEGSLSGNQLSYPSGWEVIKGVVGQRVIK